MGRRRSRPIVTAAVVGKRYTVPASPFEGIKPLSETRAFYLGERGKPRHIYTFREILDTNSLRRRCRRRWLR